MMHSIQEGSSLAAFPAGAAELLTLAEQDSFDLGADWFALLGQTSLSPGQAPRWVHGTAPSGQQMLLPLVNDTQGRGRLRSLTNFYSTLYRPLLTPGVVARDMAAWIRQWASQARPSMISFEAMDIEHPSFLALEGGLRDAGLLPYRFFAFANWYLKAEGLSWEAYLKTLSSKLRNTLKRLGRKFAEESAGRFDIVTAASSAEQVQAALAAYETVYASSWKVPEPFPQFLPGLVQLAARKGWLRLGVAYAGEQPVAAQIWLVVAGRACIYKVGYDEKFSAFSPGALLTGQLMHYVLEVDRVREVDYLIGDDSYKRIWMSDRRERWGLVAYNPKTLSGLALAGRESAWRRIKPVWTRWRERAAAKEAAAASAASTAAKGEDEEPTQKVHAKPVPAAPHARQTDPMPPAEQAQDAQDAPVASAKPERKAQGERPQHGERKPKGERKQRPDRPPQAEALAVPDPAPSPAPQSQGEGPAASA
jgi:CelD/BcsL family acetyltransferase involved in cellulose biosynthesis